MQRKKVIRAMDILSTAYILFFWLVFVLFFATVCSFPCFRNVERHADAGYSSV